MSINAAIGVWGGGGAVSQPQQGLEQSPRKFQISGYLRLYNALESVKMLA